MEKMEIQDGAIANDEEDTKNFMEGYSKWGFKIVTHT